MSVEMRFKCGIIGQKIPHPCLLEIKYKRRTLGDWHMLYELWYFVYNLLHSGDPGSSICLKSI